MQGRVELCSTEFAGAGFKFSFRYIPVTPQAAQRILPAQNEADITKSDSQGKHILIAEDEKVNRVSWMLRSITSSYLIITIDDFL